MPYIEWNSRADLTPLGNVAETPGELNFQITLLVLDYLETKGLSYQTINDIQGAIRNAGVEFDRRVTAPYEAKKILQNGDVYGPVLERLSDTKGRGTQLGVAHAQDRTEVEANTQGSPRGSCSGDCRCQGRHRQAEVRP